MGHFTPEERLGRPGPTRGTDGAAANLCQRSLISRLLTIQAEAIFGQRTGLAGLRPEYSPGEPAVNIYTAGGEFAPHTDKQSVSLLVPLRRSTRAKRRPRQLSQLRQFNHLLQFRQFRQL